MLWSRIPVAYDRMLGCVFRSLWERGVLIGNGELWGVAPRVMKTGKQSNPATSPLGAGPVIPVAFLICACAYLGLYRARD